MTALLPVVRIAIWIWGRAFNSAMTACVASCIADDSGRGRNASLECVTASASSCRIAGGNVNNMGFFDSTGTVCVQTAGDCDSEFGLFAEASNSGNSCVSSCTDIAHGIDPSENLCKATMDHNVCREAGRVLQGGMCAAACSGATPVITAFLNATCVAAADCGAMGLGVSVENVVYSGPPVATSTCSGANTSSCYLAGASTYFFQGSSCVDTCTDDETPYKAFLE